MHSRTPAVSLDFNREEWPFSDWHSAWARSAQSTKKAKEQVTSTEVTITGLKDTATQLFQLLAGSLQVRCCPNAGRLVRISRELKFSVDLNFILESGVQNPELKSNVQTLQRAAFKSRPNPAREPLSCQNVKVFRLKSDSFLSATCVRVCRTRFFVANFLVECRTYAIADSGPADSVEPKFAQVLIVK